MTVYEVRISDWSSAVCSSDLRTVAARDRLRRGEDETGDRAAEDRAADLQHHLGRRRGADRLEHVDLALRARHRFVDVDRAHQIVGQPRARLVARILQLLLKERSEEHTSELQSLMRISYAVFCLKKKNTQQ